MNSSPWGRLKAFAEEALASGSPAVKQEEPAPSAEVTQKTPAENKPKNARKPKAKPSDSEQQA